MRMHWLTLFALAAFALPSSGQTIEERLAALEASAKKPAIGCCCEGDPARCTCGSGCRCPLQATATNVPPSPIVIVSADGRTRYFLPADASPSLIEAVKRLPQSRPLPMQIVPNGMGQPVYPFAPTVVRVGVPMVSSMAAPHSGSC